MKKDSTPPGKKKTPLPVSRIESFVKAKAKIDEAKASKKEAPAKEEAKSGFEDPEYIKKSYKPTVSTPEAKKDDRSEMLRSGLFKEKDGDVFPTEKYHQLNKAGKLKSFLEEFKKRESAGEKFVAEKAGKPSYEVEKRRVSDAAASLKDYK